MKIITVSREFGSGGRELGKRLADTLGIPCYDHEIVDMIAEKLGFDKNYISHVSEKDIRMFYPSTIGNRFMVNPLMFQQPVKIVAAQHEIIRQLACQSDCVIVGRCADVQCREWNPLNMFVYADRLSKLRRCEEHANENEHISEKEICRKMKQIDKERAAYRKLFTDEKWGRKESYHLCINTSGKEIKTLISAVAAYVNAWF